MKLGKFLIPAKSWKIMVDIVQKRDCLKLHHTMQIVYKKRIHDGSHEAVNRFIK